MSISCQKCGTLIPRQGPNHKYCDTCKETIRNEQTRIRVQTYRLSKKEENIVLCKACGIPITVQGNNHKYCNTCQENIRKEQIRIARQN